MNVFQNLVLDKLTKRSTSLLSFKQEGEFVAGFCTSRRIAETKELNCISNKLAFYINYLCEMGYVKQFSLPTELDLAITSPEIRNMYFVYLKLEDGISKDYINKGLGLELIKPEGCTLDFIN